MAARGPITVVLAGPPRGKGRPRFARATGHAYTDEKTRSYEGALSYAAQQVMRGATPLEGPIGVLVIAIFPVPASWSAKKRAAALACEIWPIVKPDVDNLVKVLDALNEIVFRDDVLIVDSHVIKRYGDRPRLVIEVREIQSSGDFVGRTHRTPERPALGPTVPAGPGAELFDCGATAQHSLPGGAQMHAGPGRGHFDCGASASHPSSGRDLEHDPGEGSFKELGQ